jgi:hypothetical protein
MPFKCKNNTKHFAINYHFHWLQGVQSAHHLWQTLTSFLPFGTNIKCMVWCSGDQNWNESCICEATNERKLYLMSGTRVKMTAIQKLMLSSLLHFKYYLHQLINFGWYISSLLKKCNVLPDVTESMWQKHSNFKCYQLMTEAWNLCKHMYTCSNMSHQVHYTQTPTQSTSTLSQFTLNTFDQTSCRFIINR